MSGVKDSNLEASISVPIEEEEERIRLTTVFNSLLIKSLSSKIDIETACLIDLLRMFMPSGWKLYNTKGFEL